MKIIESSFEGSFPCFDKIASPKSDCKDANRRLAFFWFLLSRKRTDAEQRLQTPSKSTIGLPLATFAEQLVLVPSVFRIDHFCYLKQQKLT